MCTVTWLHLSDFHLRAEEHYRWNEDIVLRALLEDVRGGIIEKGLKPDFILVSGDIAFSGSAAEYKFAHDFFDQLRAATSLSKERMFIVPGNHDVDRSLISQGAHVISDSLVDRDTTNAILTTPEDRRLILARFRGYESFVNDYFSEHLTFDHQNYFYVRTLDIGEHRIVVLGMNSAWLCGSDEDKAKGLLIGERQTRTALDISQEAKATLKIALLHHPFDWLREFDQKDSAALLLSQCDFIIHGHLHQATMTHLLSPDSAAMVIGGGASYDNRQETNRYNWVQLDLAAGIGAVHLRRYSDEQGGFWAKDTLTYRNAPDGVYAFSLRSVLPHPRRTAQHSPVRRDSFIPDSDALQPTNQITTLGAEPIAALSCDLENLRRQLNQRMDDSGLDAFCLDHFPDVYDRFGRGMGKHEKITLLLDFCRRDSHRYQKLLSALPRDVR